MFNPKAFEGNAEDVYAAIESLQPEQKQEAIDLLNFVVSNPGVPVPKTTKPETLGLLVRLGIIDYSKITTRQTEKGVYFPTTPYVWDVFDKSAGKALSKDLVDDSKLLLNSFRYGQFYSSPGRGKIEKPFWIVNALIRDGAIGVQKPATAIGEDYPHCTVTRHRKRCRATDLDVLALRYTESFGSELIIAECKSGQIGPLDRIFWLSGVHKFSHADRALLVRKGTKWNIKDFAKECGVEILDLHRVDELESNFKITNSEWPGWTDRAFFETALPNWNSALRSRRELWELYLTLTSEVRYEDFFPSINFLLYQLRLLTRSWKANANSSLHRFLLGESIAQLSVFFMRVSQRTFDLAEGDRNGYIEKGLRYGSVDAKFAERMMNSAFNLTRQAVLHYTDRVQDIDRKVFEVPTPPGTQEVLSIISLILREYPRSLNLPQICDLMLAEVFVKENRNKGWLRRVYPNNDLAPRVEIVKEYLRLLTQSGACPPDVLKALAFDSLDNGHKPPDQGPPNPSLSVRQESIQQTLHLDEVEPLKGRDQSIGSGSNEQDLGSNALAPESFQRPDK